LNPEPPEYQAGVPTTWPKISIPKMVTADKKKWHFWCIKKEIWVMILKH
jgi:hypothetical protein